MAETEIIKDLLQRVQAGDQAAAAAVYQRFASQLVALARDKLDVRVRRKLDPEDVVQSVFHSFFHRHAGGDLEFANIDSLWGLLSLITIRKCGHKIECYYSAGRDVAREQAPRSTAEESHRFWEAVATEPSPSQALILSETLEQVMRSLDNRQRRILMLSLQGYENAEIAEQLACSDRTVRRALEQVREQLEKLRDEG